MHLSRFMFVGLFVACVGGCFEEDPAEDEETGDEAPDPQNPRAGGALQGTLYWTRNTELHRLNLVTGVHSVLGAGRDADVAPDGKVVFVGADLVEASADALGAATTIVKHDFSSAQAHDDNFEAPKVSPDGTKVAYGDLARSLFVVNRADGSVVASFEATGAERYDRPTWTPDGRLVLAGGFGNRGLFVTDATLTTLTRFDPNLDVNVAYPAKPAVSPDGTTVAFRVEDSIQTLKLDGTGLMTLTDASDEEPTNPTWSPDGAYVAYTMTGRIIIRPATGGAAIDVLEQFPAFKAAELSFGGLTEQIAWSR